MKVYGNPFSTCTRKVLMTLAEKGASAELVVVDLSKGEQKQHPHVERQPFGVVPVFEDEGGYQIYESRAIIRYLDRKLGGDPLTPTDLIEFAEMERWISVEQSYFSPSALTIARQVLWSGGKPDEAVVRDAKAKAEKALDVADARLAGREYLSGPFSLADISWMPYLEFFEPAKMGEVITSRPNVAAWWNRIRTRPTWQKVTGRG